MSKSLFKQAMYFIVVLGLASSAFCQTQSGTTPDFIRPFPSPTPPRPTPTPTPVPPPPTPTPTPTPGPSAASIMGAVINQRGLGSRTSSAIRAGGAANVMGSRSYTYSVPMFSLPGRHGLNLNLGLYYNSLLWESVLGTGGVTINPELSSPSSGFHLDYGYISWSFVEFSGTTATLIDATGAKHPLIATDQTATLFHTIDSTYISVQHHYATSSTDIDSDIVTYKNGMQTFYQEAPGSSFSCCAGAVGNSSLSFITRPIKIEDTSGNFITINYLDNATTKLSSVVDTIGRTISFVYNGGTQPLLSCVTDGATCNAVGSRTFNFSWNPNYILNYQFALYLNIGLQVIAPLQGSQFPYTVLSGVTRPDGTKVQFNYGDWLIVNDIQELSNNGSLRYESSYNFPLASSGALSDPPTYTQQTVTTFDKDGNPKQAQWLYQSVLTNPTPSERIVSCFAVTDPVGTSHITTMSAKGDIFDGLPVKATTGAGSTAPCTVPPTTVFESVSTQWVTDTDSSGAFNGTNPRVQTITKTLSDGTTQSQKQIAYDVHGNESDVKHFDFGSGKPGPLLRETVATYATNVGNIFTLPTDIQIKDGAGNLLSHETFSYDDYSQVPLQSVGSFPPGFDSANFGTVSGPPRGNLTGETLYANAAANTGAVTAVFTYDIFGNALTSQAGCCRQAREVFSANTQYAYPDSVSVGPVSAQLTTTYVYNMANGRASSIIDPNGQRTQLAFDIDNRPATTTTADNTIRTFTYDDAAANPVTSLSNSANSLVIKKVQDGSGRALLEQTLSGTTLISTTSRVLDALGRPTQISNPYGPTDPVLYTNYVYDPVGHITSATRPSLAGFTQNSSRISYAPSAYTDAAGTSHLGLSILTTDPSGRPRQEFTDGLGRVVRVDEPSGQTLSLTNPNSTFYNYDALGNLLKVIQGQQTRTYQYDSLSRVVSSVIPETNYQTATATYTDFGALSQTTDPRVLPGTTTHLTTTYQYDSLNRPKLITFGDGATISYAYNPPGSPNNTGGRLASATNSVASHGYQYDAMGRVTKISKTINGQTYNIGYQYHADGTLSSITYPSGRLVETPEDSIGRVSQIKNNGSSVLAIGAYNPVGDILNETFGSGITEAFTYNNQLQLGSQNDSGGTGPILSLTYGYGGASDNGQIAGITDGITASRSTSYAYDPLGRLSSAGTNDLSSPNTWQLQFNYDRYGNRLGETATGGTANMPSSQTPVDPTTNHVSCTGCAYDAAGNMTGDGVFNYSFDAIGQLAAVLPIGSSTPLATFGYDPGGLRVVKNNTVYIYSDKKVIAEYVSGTPAASPTIEYIYHRGRRVLTIASTASTYTYGDHLSGRISTDANGNVTHTYGSYPFGETWYETGTPDKWKFTTYEYDSESGLNYATARFHSPRLGRFMSVDSLAGSGGHPQSLNRYAYVNNDPVNLTDSTGMVCDDGCDDDDGGDDGGGGGGGGGDGGGGDMGTIVLCLPNPCDAGNPSDGVDVVAQYPSEYGTGDMVYYSDGSAFGFDNSDAVPYSGPDTDDTSALTLPTDESTVVISPSSGTSAGGSGEGGVDALQTGLMVAGFIPGVGDVANGINAVISLARGNYKDAALYGLSAIPFAGMIGEAAIAAREIESGVNAGRELLLDTNVVIADGKSLLSSGENIVKASASDTELAHLVEVGQIKMPRAAAEIPSVADSMNINLRINVRSLLTPKLAGNFADGIIGATALERDAILITRDEALFDAVRELGGDAVHLK